MDSLGSVREEPLVTVVMSVYRAGPHLRPALESVLGQTYRNLEILVVDDGNDDESMEQIRDLVDERLTVIRQEHAGKAAALNRALKSARGAYFAIQDADDLSDPRRIERQARFMEDRPSLACSFCGFDLIVEGERMAPLYPEKSVAECRQSIDSFGMPGHDPTTMFRMSLVREFAFEESLAIGQGFDYVLRVGEKYPMMTIGECLYSYRVDSNSHSRRDPVRRDELVRAILSRACDRRGLPESAWPPALKRPAVSGYAHRDSDNNLAAHFIESALHLRRTGQYGLALRTALACARMRPLEPHYLKALVFVLAPPPLLRLIRWRSRPIPIRSES